MNSLIRKGLLLLLGTLTAAALFAQDALTRTAPPEIDEALRGRLTAFYTHFQRGEFRQAEQFVDEDSKDLFYGAKKNRILGFVISGIEYDEDFRGAKALVACKTIIPMLGSVPLSVPITSQWRFIDGDWLMHLVERRPATEAENPEGDFSSPFGPMSFTQTAAEPGAAPQGPAGPPTIAALRNMYKVSATELRFQGAAKSARTISIKNMAQGQLAVKRYTREIPGIEILIEPESVGPGEEASVTFTYLPDVKKLQGKYRIDFMVSPLNQIVPIYLNF